MVLTVCADRKSRRDDKNKRAMSARSVQVKVSEVVRVPRWLNSAYNPNGSQKVACRELAGERGKTEVLELFRGGPQKGTNCVRPRSVLRSSKDIWVRVRSAGGLWTEVAAISPYREEGEGQRVRRRSVSGEGVGVYYKKYPPDPP